MNIGSLDLLKPNISLAVPKYSRINFRSELSDLWNAHRELSRFNLSRLKPQTPNPEWCEDLYDEVDKLKLEEQVLQWEINQIRSLAALAPREPDKFIRWFEDLKENGPGQSSDFFEWLSEHADLEQVAWFMKQEAASEMGFDDLVALTQVGFSLRAKMEMARNYWDEMGNGNEKAVHGVLLNALTRELDLSPAIDMEEIVPESLALGNILLGFAINRRYAYHSVGALGVIELTAPKRTRRVYEGLKRLGVSVRGRKYHLLHSRLDMKHSEEWNKEVLFPLVSEDPSLIPFIAEGALTRLNAGARCLACYEEKFRSQLH